jgi:hypothetical protein
MSAVRAKRGALTAIIGMSFGWHPYAGASELKVGSDLS